MGASVVQQVTSGTSSSPSLNITATAGHLFLMAIADSSSGGIQDGNIGVSGGSASFSSVFTPSQFDSFCASLKFYTATVQNSTTYTISYTGSSNATITVLEVSGAVTCSGSASSSNSTDGSPSGTNAGATTMDCGSITTSGSADVILSVAVSGDGDNGFGSNAYSNNYHSGASGTFDDTFGSQVSWTAGSYALTAAVETSIGVTPTSSTININQTQQLTATIRDQCGNTGITDTITWSILTGGGSIGSSTGLYTAPSTATTATIQAAGSLTNGTATVTVISPANGLWAIDFV